MQIPPLIYVNMAAFVFVIVKKCNVWKYTATDFQTISGHYNIAITLKAIFQRIVWEHELQEYHNSSNMSHCCFYIKSSYAAVVIRSLYNAED